MNKSNKITATEHAINNEIVDLLFATNRKAIVIASVIAALLLYLQSDVNSLVSLRTWISIVITTYLAKGLAYFIYTRKTQYNIASETWLNYLRLNSAFCGAAWGCAGLLFFHHNDYLHQAFLAMSLAGICGGAIFIYALDRYASLSFVAGLMLFFLPAYLRSGDEFSIAIALMFIAFILFITLVGFSLAHTLHENIALRIFSNDSKDQINALAQRQKLHIDNTPLAVVEWDHQFRVSSWNAAAEKMFGYTEQEALGQHIHFIVPVSQYASTDKSWHDLIANESGRHSRNQNLRKDGKVIYCEWFNTPLKDKEENIVGVASLIQDETAYKSAREEIERLAYYDALTNLPNRRLLLDRLSQSLKISRRSKSCISVMYLDLDGFKTLNDSKGHAIGDELLQQVAKRLKRAVRSHDTVSRIGGDEFVIVLEELGTELASAKLSAMAVAKKILGEINRPFNLNHYEHICTPSIGVCMYAGENMLVDEIIKRADAAMYQVKQSGRNNIMLYDESMQPTLDLMANLKNDLHLALAHGQLEVHYQAQVNQHEQIVGAEALLRWQHPEMGNISPTKFIPLAEESGLIIPIGIWVLQQACFQLKKWNDTPETSHLRISVNVSALQFAQPDFVNQVKTALKMSNCNPKQMMLELTESLVVRNINEVVDKMKSLKAMGILLSLDDFGMGYSSLSVLKQLPLDELKIDQSFVADVLESPDSALIIQTIISIGNNLGLEVIAEGVAEKAQKSFLKKVGCRAYQGYLFGKPSNIASFESALAA